MRVLIIFSACFLLSCGQNTGDKKQPSKDSLSTNSDTTKTKTDTGTTNKSKTTVINDSMPSATGASEEEIVNKLLLARPGRKWHVLTDKQAKWEKHDFEYFLTAGRKKDPNYPFIIKGDFNGDNKMDYAAIVTNDEVSYENLVTRIAILPADGNIVFIDEFSFSHSLLTLTPKSSIIGGHDEKDDNKKIKVKNDTIEVNNQDAGGYYIYWNGTAFKFLYSEG